MSKRKPRNRYYSRSKLSEYQVKKLLWLFACDVSPNEASQRMRISRNTAYTTFAKFREHFVKAGLFRSFYDVPDGYEITEREEYLFLEFHLRRLSRMNGLPAEGPGETDYHLFESSWRFEYEVYGVGNDDTNLSKLQYDDLIKTLDICGPVNSEPTRREKLLEFLMETMDRRLVALERNSQLFKSPEFRQQLRDLGNIRPKPTG